MDWRIGLIVFALGLAGRAGAVELRLANPVLPVALAGQPYAQGPMVIESGGRCPLGTATTRLVGGALPPGMTLDGAGYVQGTPRDPGRFGFAVEIRTGCSRSVEQVTLEVAMPPMLRVSASSLEFSCERGGRPPEPQRVMVSGSQPGVPYTMSAQGAPWLEFRPRRGALPPPGSSLEADSVDVFVHPEKLDSGDDHATVLTYVWGGSNPASTEVHLTVKSAGSGWDGIRTMPMITPLNPVSAVPIIIVPPATLLPAPVYKPKPVAKAPPPPAPKRPVVPITRSRIVTVPKITLPEATKGPSKLLGPPEDPPPPTKPAKKKEGGGGEH
jgi:hypothetical protein